MFHGEEFPCRFFFCYRADQKPDSYKTSQQNAAYYKDSPVVFPTIDNKFCYSIHLGSFLFVD